MRMHYKVTLLLLLILTGCATIAPYRGDHAHVTTLDASPRNVFRAVLDHALDNSIVMESSNVDLGYLRLKYRFPNAQTYRAASRVVSPYAEPMGSAINPYGQNPFVTLTIRISPLNTGQSQLKIISRFESYGVLGGIGGVGPFQMNSKGVWEKNYTDQIGIISTELRKRSDKDVTRSTPSLKNIDITGTGFFVSRKGYILTNAHIVKGCDKIVALLPDGIKAKLEMIALDEQNDLAVGKVDNLPTRWARFKSHAMTRAGDQAVAFGFPLSGALASEGNVTTGNISALAGLRDDIRYFQITVPVQPGNSGGLY